ncbi:MAG: ABC transporter permease [Chitinophagales bacterium]
MFRNYFKVALRNLLRNKTYSSINILGLAIGIACCVLIVLFVTDELSYDRFHQKADRIYRVALDAEMMGQKLQAPISPSPLAKAIKAELPEVEHACRVNPYRADALVAWGEKKFYEKKTWAWVDSTFFDIFDFEVLEGDANKALDKPNQLIISESTAEKYFGKEKAIGQILKLDNDRDYLVVAVMKDMPNNSHSRYDFLASIVSLEDEGSDNWLSSNVYTYVLLKENATQQQLETKFPDFYKNKMGPQLKQMAQMDFEEFLEAGNRFEAYLQPLTGIHLGGNLDWELQPNSDRKFIYIFSMIAFLVLLIASINFMNLATARSSKRAKEVGVRKVIGAPRSALVGQFLGEALLQSLIAMCLAVVFIELILPHFNNIVDKNMSLFGGKSLLFYGFLASIFIIVGLFAGSYPAFYLSSFRPATVLKGTLLKGSGGARFRKALVVTQFAISVALIIGVLFVSKQLSYFHNANLGFNKEQLVMIEVNKEETIQQMKTVKSEILKNPNVISITATSFLPGNGDPNQNMFSVTKEGAEQHYPLWNMEADFDFIETMGLEVLEGRAFDRNLTTDSIAAYILNESAVKGFGWENPIGKEVTEMGIGPAETIPGKIIGVVKDFHTEGFTKQIKPMIISINPRYTYNVAIRLNSTNMAESLSFIENVWTGFEPEYPFHYDFLDQKFASLYTAEERLGKVFLYFTLLAIFIACLGLFGLASYTAEQRTKEIGIRKVLGASVSHITLLLTKEFIFLVLISNIIAWPIAYYMMQKWLETFAYPADITFWTFGLASILGLVIAVLTVSFQAVKAAIGNPIQALRSE